MLFRYLVAYFITLVYPVFCCHNLELDPMTLTYNIDPDILKM